MSMETPAAFAGASTAAPGPEGDPFAAGAPAPAPAAAPAPVPVQSFKTGQIVKTADGRLAVVIAEEPASREHVEVDTNGQPTGRKVLADMPGYRLAYFAGTIDSPHTAQELGLQAP